MVTTTATDIAVSCQGVIKTYGSNGNKVVALRGIDLEVRTGELMMLVGPSGCGKTTLISVIAGILDQDEGKCVVFDHDLLHMTSRAKTRFRGHNIGFVFQQFNLIPTLLAVENVSVPLLINGVNRSEAMDRAAETLKRVGLGDRAKSLPKQLSGGQQQRVAIARALVHNPRLIVCDEPTSALDHETGHKVMELMREVAMAEQRALVIVTHDARIFEFADRIARMDDGHIVKIVDSPEGLNEQESDMIRKYVLPLVALVGVMFAIYTVVNGQRQIPPAQPVAQPAHAPYEAYVAGAGIIESTSENIAIGTPISGLVTDVFVRVGSDVKAGAALFKLDDRDLQAELVVRQASLNAAKTKLDRLKSLPRPEDIPPAQAKVNEMEASLADMKSQLALWESVSDKRAVSQDEMDRKRFAVRVAETKLVQSQAELAELKAGSWTPDIEIAKADVMSAEAQVKEMQIEIDRRIIRSPIAGRLLQVKVHPGEYATGGELSQPMMLLGNVDRMNVRVDIDENDAWRIDTSAPAEACVRGNRDLKTPLQFVRVEPYVIPKKSLTGESSERVDTRVLQILYSFDRDALPVYVGQQMDVFIQAKSLANNHPATMPASGGGKE